MACTTTYVQEGLPIPAAEVPQAGVLGFPPPVPETDPDPDGSGGGDGLSARAERGRGRPACRVDPASLFAEFQPLVRRLIRRYGGGDRELCEDLSGEIYRRFWDLLNAYDAARGIPLRPYLVRQLTASVYTYARQQWRSRRREVRLEQVSDVSGWERAADPTPEWVEVLARQQVCAALPMLIARLPPRQRRAVIWRYYEQRSFEEIASLLTIREATARSLLRHGLDKLRCWLAETGSD